MHKCIKRKYYITKPVITPSEKSEKKHFFNKYTLNQTIVDSMSHKKILLQLHEAADKCYMKAYALRCIYLISYCPHLINIPHGPKGYTPFHKVCFHGNTCLIEYMLAKGANPFLTTYTGENAICMALHFFLNNPNNNDFTCLNILCEIGCYLDMSNIHYDIFMNAALNNHNKLLAKWILLNSRTMKISRSYSNL
ncbi:PREDICTED: uncharacterized protein LOC107072777 [Polistes dominula]|uniref:Uncharacterized protein LOC107072777 n=1 Tax=Polistes dominula TaxID=743375 RepID=A0ABM1J7M2_POLDO|nr:PREDICTED: uncharacterized protein LOC107072777 [Polistes dominula]